MSVRYEIRDEDGTVLARTGSEKYVGRMVSKQRRNGNDRALVAVQIIDGNVADEIRVPPGMTLSAR